jgi:hypothetical protein
MRQLATIGSWRPSAAGDHRRRRPSAEATIGGGDHRRRRPSAAGDHRQLATIGKINSMPNNTFTTSEHLILSHFAKVT